jgi:hypothetical protein
MGRRLALDLELVKKVARENRAAIPARPSTGAHRALRVQACSTSSDATSATNPVRERTT